MSLGCGVGLWESAEVRFNPTGQVTVYTGPHSHGQSHQTTFAQIAADELGVPIENIDIVHETVQRVMGKIIIKEHISTNDYDNFDIINTYKGKTVKYHLLEGKSGYRKIHKR